MEGGPKQIASHPKSKWRYPFLYLRTLEWIETNEVYEISFMQQCIVKVVIGSGNSSHQYMKKYYYFDLTFNQPNWTKPDI